MMTQLFDTLTLIICTSVCGWIGVLIAILLDLWDALFTAKKLKRALRSHRLRHTLGKICEYWRVLLLALLIDVMGSLLPVYNLAYVTIVTAVGLICIEAKSMFEHARQRRSKTVELQQIIKSVIESASKKDALESIRRVMEYLEAKDEKGVTS